MPIETAAPVAPVTAAPVVAPTLVPVPTSFPPPTSAPVTPVTAAPSIAPTTLAPTLAPSAFQSVSFVNGPKQASGGSSKQAGQISMTVILVAAACCAVGALVARKSMQARAPPSPQNQPIIDVEL